MLPAWIVLWTAWALIIYTYLLFPVLLFILSRAFGSYPRLDEPYPDDEDLPRVAVVLAAFNEEHVIAEKLRNIWLLDYPYDKLEVYIGTDGCTDATASVVSTCTDRRLHLFPFPQRRGKISVLNDLRSVVEAEIVVMTDASTMFAEDAVRNLVRHFSDPRVGCVTGELCIQEAGDVSSEGLYLRYDRWIKRSEGRLGCVTCVTGAIFAIRKCLWEVLPASTISEDLVLCARVLAKGKAVIAEPHARAVDPPCTTVKAEMGRKMRIGAGVFQALGLTTGILSPLAGLRCFTYIGHKVLRWFVPLFFIVAVVANSAIVLWPGCDEGNAARALLAGVIAGALASVWTYRLPMGRKPPKLLRPLAYFYLMNYALLRGFVRFLMGRQPVTWERADSLPISADAAAARWGRRGPAIAHRASAPSASESVAVVHVAASGEPVGAGRK
jgi:cellulose synthase/poly-beta-1,6-N-acetylglucosamine synthase-like glycosyltransferase